MADLPTGVGLIDSKPEEAVAMAVTIDFSFFAFGQACERTSPARICTPLLCESEKPRIADQGLRTKDCVPSQVLARPSDDDTYICILRLRRHGRANVHCKYTLQV